MKRLAPLLLLGLAGCSGSTPTGTEGPPAPVLSALPISGTVTATLTGEPIAGATLTLAHAAPVQTTAWGEWTLSFSSTVPDRIQIDVTAPEFLPRRVHIKGGSGARSGIRIDMIRDTAPFSLAFYREFVRNGYSDPGNFRPLRRWTQNPSVYVDIRNPRTGVLTGDEIESIRSAAADAIAAYTGGRFALARFEWGTESRPEAPGWINVDISYEPDGDYCGISRVGSNPGRIVLNYDRCATECGSVKLGLRTMRHEFGHAMGYYHVSDQRALIHPDPSTRAICTATTFSDNERYHARLAYARPVGNTDIDADPLAAALLTSPAVPFVVRCFRR